MKCEVLPVAEIDWGWEGLRQITGKQHPVGADNRQLQRLIAGRKAIANDLRPVHVIPGMQAALPDEFYDDVDLVDRSRNSLLQDARQVRCIEDKIAINRLTLRPHLP